MEVQHAQPESEMQPTCNEIFEAREVGSRHCCVSNETVGTQTDEPMDVKKEKCQELYFVVFICLIYIFVMLHDMNIQVQEKAKLQKETLQCKYVMANTCFDIYDFKDNAEDISFFTGLGLQSKIWISRKTGV